jgi:hypothetical protein
METPNGHVVQTRSNSTAVIFTEYNGYLFGAWNDGNNSWFPARWHLDGSYSDDPETDTDLDLCLKG